jgi:hypothetical protein
MTTVAALKREMFARRQKQAMAALLQGLEMLAFLQVLETVGLLPAVSSTHVLSRYWLRCSGARKESRAQGSKQRKLLPTTR